MAKAFAMKRNRERLLVRAGTWRIPLSPGTVPSFPHY